MGLPLFFLFKDSAGTSLAAMAMIVVMLPCFLVAMYEKHELQKKNSKYILLQVSDIPKTSLVLERQFGVTEYSVQDEHTLRIYDTSLDMAAVNKALVVQDIAVISSQLCNDTLEDYFKKITGGEGIA